MKATGTPRHRRLLLALFAACLLVRAASAADAFPASAGNVPFTDTSFPGGIVRVPLPDGTTAAFANGHRSMVVQDARGTASVIAAVPLAAAPGSGRVYAQLPLGTVALAYRIEPRDYPVQRLSFDNQRMVDPNAEDLARIDREQVEIDGARSRFSAWVPRTLTLAAPVEGPLSSPFGTRRVLNGQPRNSHNGLDFAAPTGARIRAPLDGEVAGIGNYFFTGNTVFVDHGQGFVTMYCHLSRVDVAVGDRLREGDAIGEVGATGRATGPHLHWAVYLGNVPVDPMLLLREVPAAAP